MKERIRCNPPSSRGTAVGLLNAAKSQQLLFAPTHQQSSSLPAETESLTCSETVRQQRDADSLSTAELSTVKAQHKHAAAKLCPRQVKPLLRGSVNMPLHKLFVPLQNKNSNMTQQHKQFAHLNWVLVFCSHISHLTSPRLSFPYPADSGRTSKMFSRPCGESDEMRQPTSGGVLLDGTELGGVCVVCTGCLRQGGSPGGVCTTRFAYVIQ